MLHRMNGIHGVSYFIERPWGNLIVYEAGELSARDWEHLKGRGGVFRQILLGPVKSQEIVKEVFDRFGAAVVTPLPLEFNPHYPVEQIEVDFVDPGIRMLHSMGITALVVIVKDQRYVFTDDQLSLVDGEITHRESGSKFEGMEFIKSLNGPAMVLTPQYRGENFIRI